MHESAEVKRKLTKTAFIAFLLFAGLATVQLAFLRLAFLRIDTIGLSVQQNRIYMLCCLAIIIGMALPAFFIQYFPKNMILSNLSFLSIFCIASAISIFFSCIIHSAVAVFFICLSLTLISAALNMSLQAGSRAWEREHIGIFLGVTFAASDLLVYLLLSMPLNKMQGLLPALFIGALLLLTAYLGSKLSRGDQSPPPSQRMEGLPKGLITKCFLAILFFCLLDGMIDSLHFFNENLNGMPHYRLFLYLFAVAVDLLSGWLFAKGKWHVTVVICISLVCLGQSLAFFSTTQALAAPYAVLSLSGTLPLELFAVAVPVYYASISRKPELAGMGYALLYFGFLCSAAFFEGYSSPSYVPVLGLILVGGLGLILFILMISLEHERINNKRIIDLIREDLESYKQKASAASNIDPKQEGLQVKEIMNQLSLTHREKEVCMQLLAGHALKQIAYNTNISYSTVKFHCQSLYRKLGISSRSELPPIFGLLVENEDMEDLP